MSRTKQQLAIAKKLLNKPKGKLQPIDLMTVNMPDWMTRAYKNNHYVVMIKDDAVMTGGVNAVRAMVQRHDGKPIPNHWAEMQSIKNELFGPETTGIEYYPAESELMDVANIYWLWILPPGSFPIAVNP